MGARGALRRSSMALVLALSSACAGRSERSGEPSDEASGGTAGSGGSSRGGDTGSGGAEPAGGTSDGGTIPIPSGGVNAGGTGGTIVVGGSGGTAGGPQVCPTCPEADYGLVIEGDGMPYDIDYNGTIDTAGDRATPACPEQPITGTTPICSRTVNFNACEDPMSGPPCLEVLGSAARYVDHQTGKLWTGYVANDVRELTSVAGVASGTLTIQLTDSAGVMLALTVRYTICTQLGSLRIPC